MNQPRDVLMEFVLDMERKLKNHDKDRGDSWKREDWDILPRILEEISEALKNDEPDEWVDVANFVFFAWYRSKIRVIRKYRKEASNDGNETQA